MMIRPLLELVRYRLSAPFVSKQNPLHACNSDALGKGKEEDTSVAFSETETQDPPLQSVFPQCQKGNEGETCSTMHSSSLQPR